MRPSAPAWSLALTLSCAHSPPVPEGGARAVPLATCRSVGAMGNPCFPTPAELGSRHLDPCFDWRRGRCGGAGRGLCYLEPIADGGRCSAGGGFCYGGHCTTSPEGR